MEPLKYIETPNLGFWIYRLCKMDQTETSIGMAPVIRVLVEIVVDSPDTRIEMTGLGKDLKYYTFEGDAWDAKEHYQKHERSHGLFIESNIVNVDRSALQIIK